MGGKLRFTIVFAVIVLLIGVVQMVLGIGRMTWWKPSSTVTYVSEPAGKAPLIFTAQNVLESTAQVVKIRAKAPEKTPVTLVLGTTTDAEVFVEGQPHLEVYDFLKGHLLATKLVDDKNFSSSEQSVSPSVSAGHESDTPNPATDTDSSASKKTRDEASDKNKSEKLPQGYQLMAGTSAQSQEESKKPADLSQLNNMDMWTQKVTGQGQVHLDWQLADGRYSVLAVTDGKKEAPTLELSWRVHPNYSAAWVIFGVGLLFFLSSCAYLILHQISERRSVRYRREVVARQEAKQIASQVVEKVAGRTGGQMTSPRRLRRRELREKDLAQQDEESL